MMMENLPERHGTALAYLAMLDSAQFSAVVSTFAAAKAPFRPSQVQDLLKESLPDIKPDELRALSLTLLDYASLLESDEFSKDDLLSFVESMLDQVEQIGEPQRATLLERIDILLREKAIVLSAKTGDVLYDNFRNFREARVLTDLRPVFYDTDAEPELGGILHNLKIVYMENSKEKTFFVSLDDNDLQNLLAVVARAEKKSQKLKSRLAPVVSIVNLGAQ